MNELYNMHYVYANFIYSFLFVEMAERHDAAAVLSLARDLVLQVQTLIENK